MLKNKILKTDQKYVYNVKAEKLIIRWNLFYYFINGSYGVIRSTIAGIGQEFKYCIK
jgi:hypothetical protein